jgi:hypothetical protein
MEVSGQTHVPAALSRGKCTRYSLNRRLRGSRSRNGYYGEKSRTQTGIEHPSFIPQSGHRTDWAVTVPVMNNLCYFRQHLQVNSWPVPKKDHSSFLLKVKGKGHPITCDESPDGEQRYSSTLSLTSALDGGGWSTPCGPLYPRERDPVSTVTSFLSLT